MIRALSHIRAEPWAITPEALRTILEIAQRENASPQAIAARLGRPLEHTYDVELRDGVAIVPVIGPLFRYANLFTAVSGATSYDLLARDFTRAVEDPRVDAIVLQIDSPGGEANGVSEFADMIFAARGTKPIVAYVGGSGASAAYWIASAADEIVIDDTAQLGSIGVVLAIEDRREREAKGGVTRYEIVSAATPYKRVDPATDDGRSRLQRRVDALAEVFVAKLARNRAVGVDTVLTQFGQGDVFVGLAAIAAGLADRLGSFEALVQQLQDRTQAKAVTAANDDEDTAMSEQTHSTTTAAQIDAPQVDTQADAETSVRAAERDRIRSILTCEAAQGRHALAMHFAFDTDLSAEVALAALEKVPVPAADTGFTRFDTAMRAAGNPQVGVEHDEDTEALDAAVRRSVELGQRYGIH